MMVMIAGARRAARRASLGVTIAAASLACEDARAPLDLSAHVEPGDECVTLVHAALELGEAVHGFVADRSGSPGGWALISFVNEHELIELGIARVPASDTEAATPLVGLGITVSDPDLVELRGGAHPGQLWVLSRTKDVTVVRRLEPELGQIASNGSLGLFPADGGSSSCPTAWGRSLVLVEGRPYLLAIPNCSDTPTLDLHFVELDPETLEFGTSWQLSFDPCAGLDPVTCAQALAYTLEQISPGTPSPLADASRIAVGFVQTRAYALAPNPANPLGQTLLRSDVSLLDMRLTQAGPTARLVSFIGVWDHALPVELEPPTLGQDPYSTLIHVRNQALSQDSALMRFDTIDELYIQLHDHELMPFAGRGQLVQLASETAMVDVDEGAVLGVPLVDVESWPSWMDYELIDDPEIVRVEPAGVGHLLLRRAEGPPQVLRVNCFGD